MYCIGIEELVPNSLIEIVERTGERTVSSENIQDYGNKIVQKMNESKKEAILLFTRDRTKQFFYDYAEVFSVAESNGKTVIMLKDGISTDYLRKQFRTRLTLDEMIAFASKEAVETVVKM